MLNNSQVLYNHYLLYTNTLKNNCQFDKLQKEVTDYISGKKFRYNKEWGCTHKLLVPEEEAIIDDEYFKVGLMSKQWLSFQILNHLPLLEKQIRLHLKEHIKDYYLQSNTDPVLTHKYVKKVCSILKFDSSWMTSFSGRDYTHAHHHVSEGAVFSGVYYYSCPPVGDDKRAGSISFLLEPNITHTWPLPLCCPSEQNIQPITGDLLIFPSDLMHQVNASLTDETRYSISFNIVYDPKNA